MEGHPFKMAGHAGRSRRLHAFLVSGHVPQACQHCFPAIQAYSGKNHRNSNSLHLVKTGFAANQINYFFTSG